MYIIKSITKHGVVTETYDHARATHPQPGDHIRLGDKLGRFWEVETGWCGKGEAHICEQQGHAFLLESGAVSIGGGPFRVIKLADVEPTMELHVGKFWNWGDNYPGADQGVDYHILRPIFEYKGGA